jgi:hypothetical protein
MKTEDDRVLILFVSEIVSKYFECQPSEWWNSGQIQSHNITSIRDYIHFDCSIRAEIITTADASDIWNISYLNSVTYYKYNHKHISETTAFTMLVISFQFLYNRFSFITSHIKTIFSLNCDFHVHMAWDFHFGEFKRITFFQHAEINPNDKPYDFVIKRIWNRICFLISFVVDTLTFKSSIFIINV